MSFWESITFEGAATKLAGLVGAVISTRFLQGTFPERCFMALSGAAISFYTAPYVSKTTGLPEGLAGFLLGLFGMAIVSKAWEYWQSAPIGLYVNDWLRRKFGVKDSAGADCEIPAAPGSPGKDGK